MRLWDVSTGVVVRRLIGHTKAIFGVALSAVIWRLQAYLLRWQQHNMAE